MKDIIALLVFVLIIIVVGLATHKVISGGVKQYYYIPNNDIFLVCEERSGHDLFKCKNLLTDKSIDVIFNATNIQRVER